MNNVMRLILATILLAFSAFCLFGYLATFEFEAHQVMAWRIGYIVLGVGSLAIALRLAWGASSLLRSK